jgi:indole-3-acetate monooxygenase
MATAPRTTDASVLDSRAIIANTHGLAPEIDRRADEIAALRRLPADLVAQLKSAGVFRMSMPRAWGGPEMTPREQYDVYEILGAADASVAWCVKIGSDSGYYAAPLDDSVARTVYKDLDDVTAGQVPPNGKRSAWPAVTASPAAGRSAAARLTLTSSSAGA